MTMVAPARIAARAARRCAALGEYEYSIPQWKYGITMSACLRALRTICAMSASSSYAMPGRVSMALFDDLVATASIHCDRS